MPTPINAIAEAVKEGLSVFGNWQKGREKARMKAAIEAAERYIFINEKEGEFNDLNEIQQKKLLAYNRKIFFKYNQG